MPMSVIRLRRFLEHASVAVIDLNFFAAGTEVCITGEDTLTHCDSRA